MVWEVLQGDCLEAMRDIPDGSIDVCITDPPYGTTACSWDSVIPFAPMWAALKRVVKKNGAIALFGSQPFTSALVMSNPGMFRYCWTWKKQRAANFLFGNSQPLRITEDVAVFYSTQPTYNPQKTDNPKNRSIHVATTGVTMYEHLPNAPRTFKAGTRYEIDKLLPTTLVEFLKDESPIHPTQKPVELMRYLVRTYTNEGDKVLDFTCGSGSTGVACAIENRNFIGIEQDPHYVEVSRARISRATGVHAEIPRRVVIERELPLFSAA